MGKIRNVYVGTSPILRVWKGTTKIFEYNSTDTTKPVVTSFTIPSIYYNLTVPITTFTATDNIAVAKYLITETPTIPTISDANWNSTPQTEHTFSTEGLKTLYAWVKDANDNISDSVTDTIEVVIEVENTYYVSTTGNDSSGNGSISLPFASLYKASTAATISGNRIYILSGTYTESLRSNIAVGVSIVGAGVDATIIYMTYGGTGPSDATICLNSTTLNTNGNQSISGITFNGSNFTCYKPITVWHRGNVEIYNCKFENFYTSPVTFYGDSHESYTPASTWITGNKFHNNTVINCGTYNVSPPGLMFSGQDGIEFYNNHMEETRGGLLGTDLMSSQTCKNVVIRDNTLIRTPYYYPNWGFVMEIRWNFGGCILNNNRIKGVTDLCWNFVETSDYSWLITNNEFGRDSLEGYYNNCIAIEANTQNLVIDNNVFHYAFTGISCVSGYTGAPVYQSDISITRNTFWGMGSSNTPLGGMYANSIYFATNNDSFIQNVDIWNNTFVGSTNARSAISIGWKGTHSTYSIKNNIVKKYVTAPIIMELSPVLGSTLSIDLVSLENNDYYNNGNSNTIKYINVIPTNITSVGIVTVDPLLVSDTDLHLQATSTMIDGGVNVGLPFNDSAPDIGAYETI